MVRALVDQTLPAGRHAFTLDASSGAGPALASGVYFLDLDASGTRRIERFVLMR
jgi:hypothetical protein